MLGGGTSGEIPPSLDSQAFAGLVASLSDDYDCVLIDGAAPLEASEAMPLLRVAEGILVVARLGHTRDVSAARLRELLELPSTAPVLGVVANDVPNRELKRTGFGGSQSRGLAGRSATRR
jgi:Mrp family chromosome partitioning ATPase